jgi:hypothetical protein
VLVYAQDMNTIAPIFSLSNIVHFASAPTQNTFAIVDTEDVLSLWDAEDFQQTQVLYEGACIQQPLWSSDGRRIVASTGNGTYFWDGETGNALGGLNKHPVEIRDEVCDTSERDKALSPTGEMFASAYTGDGTVILWNVDTGEILQLAGGPRDRYRTLAFSPDGSMLAVGSAYADLVVLWDTETGEIIGEFSAFGEALAFSPDGNMLVAGAGNLWSEVTVWNVAKGEQVSLLEAPLVVGNLRWTSDSNLLLGNFTDRTLVSDNFLYMGSAVRAWELPSGEERQIFDLAFPEVIAYEPKPEETLFGIGSGEADGRLLIWNSATDELYNTLLVPGQSHTYNVTTTQITSFALSPDETLLAAGTDNALVILWDFATGEQLQTLRGPNPLEFPNDLVHDVQWSADGHTLAALYGDHTLALWDVSSL